VIVPYRSHDTPYSLQESRDAGVVVRQVVKQPSTALSSRPDGSRLGTVSKLECPTWRVELIAPECPNLHNLQHALCDDTGDGGLTTESNRGPPPHGFASKPWKQFLDSTKRMLHARNLVFMPPSSSIPTAPPQRLVSPSARSEIGLRPSHRLEHWFRGHNDARSGRRRRSLPQVEACPRSRDR
jgi:hypothetical protein